MVVTVVLHTKLPMLVTALVPIHQHSMNFNLTVDPPRTGTATLLIRGARLLVLTVLDLLIVRLAIPVRAKSFFFTAYLFALATYCIAAKALSMLSNCLSKSSWGTGVGSGIFDRRH